MDSTTIEHKRIRYSSRSPITDIAELRFTLGERLWSNNAHEIYRTGEGWQDMFNSNNYELSRVTVRKFKVKVED